MLDKRLVREAMGEKVYFGLSVALGVFLSVLIVLQAYFLAQIIDRVFWRGGGWEDVRQLVGIILALIAARAAVQICAEVLAHEGAARVREKLRGELYQHLIRLGPVAARGEQTGEIANTFVEGIESLEDYFARYIPQLLLAAFIPLILLTVVFPLDGITGLTLLITVPLIPMFMMLIGKLADAKAKSQWQSLGRMSAHFLNVLQGLATLKVFNRSRSQIEVIRRVSDNFRKGTLGVLRIAFLSALVLELMATISTALIAVSLGLRLVEGVIPFREAFFLLLLAPEVYQPLRTLGIQYHASMSGSNAAQRIFEILDTPLPTTVSPVTGASPATTVSPVTTAPPATAVSPVTDDYPVTADHPGLMPDRAFTSPAAPVNPAPDSKSVIMPGVPEICLEEVCFRFEPETPLLEGVSFRLAPGEHVALIGVSGAGKSTIANLLLGFIQPASGTIKVNGIPLAQIPPQDWLKQIAYIPQNPYLFPGTIEENIRIGRPGASTAEVIQAAELAGAHEFINQFKQGYHTRLGERGVNLSGGQAQRIAIARAFLKDAPVLILDEATAGLDAANEELIHQAISRLSQNRTMLFITHRQSSLRLADRVLRLVDGKVESTRGGDGA